MPSSWMLTCLAYLNKTLLPGKHEMRACLRRAFGLPIRCSGVDIEAIMNAMQRDKKVRAGRTRWVLANQIGHVEVYSDIDAPVVRNAIVAVCSGEGEES